THVDVRAVISLVLALQAMGNLRSETTERLVAGVDNEPIAADGTGLGKYGLHSSLVACAGTKWGVGPRGPAKKGGEVYSSRCPIAKARPRGRPWCDPAADAAGNRRNCLYNAGPIYGVSRFSRFRHRRRRPRPACGSGAGPDLPPG